MNKKGFSILEIIIVLAVLALIIPAIFTLFFANIRAQSKVAILQEVKKNGDDALSTIEALTKQYARTLHSDNPPTELNKICESSSYSTGQIYIQDRNNYMFWFYTEDNKIASESSNGDKSFLTNDKVEISNFSLTCEDISTFSPPIISVSFTVSQAGNSTRQEEKASLNYQTKVKLRSY